MSKILFLSLLLVFKVLNFFNKFKVKFFYIFLHVNESKRLTFFYKQEIPDNLQDVVNLNDEEFQTKLTQMFDLEMFSNYKDISKSFAENINKPYITAGLYFDFCIFTNVFKRIKKTAKNLKSLK